MQPKTLPIVIYPDKRLTQTSTEIKEIDEDTKSFVKDLIHTMYYHEGVGLSAIQVGRSERIFVVDGLKVGKGDDAIVFINPTIEATSPQNITVEEGCLSFPGIFIKVKRPELVIMNATDLSGERFQIKAQGLLARVLLHEFDHLNGKMLSDLANIIQKKKIKKESKKWEQVIDFTEKFVLEK